MNLHEYLCTTYSPAECERLFALVDERAAGREWPARVGPDGSAENNPVGTAYNSQMRGGIWYTVLREHGESTDVLARYAGAYVRCGEHVPDHAWIALGWELGRQGVCQQCLDAQWEDDEDE